MVDLTKLCEELASKHHVKNRDILALFGFFKSNFNNKRKDKRLSTFNDEQICGLLSSLGSSEYKDFVEFIKIEFTGRYKDENKMYLAEEYENYNAIAKRYDKTLVSTLNFVKKLSNVINEKRKLMEKRELIQQEIKNPIWCTSTDGVNQSSIKLVGFRMDACRFKPLPLLKNNFPSGEVLFAKKELTYI